MNLLAETSFRAAGTSAGFEFSFPYRRFEAPEGAGADDGRQLGFTVTLTPGIGLSAADGLRAAAAFLVDTAFGAVPAATLARMIGRYLFASGAAGAAGEGMDAVTILLASTHGDRATALARERVERPEFDVELTAFGAAHIVHEDDTLGLYILEIAPRGIIPAHCHRVMHESELILDDGLLQQDRPVTRGNAFVWPLGHVHAYRNPTGQPRRILCLDSPRFMPTDEVPLAAAAPLVPLAPLVNYLERISP
jgi:hypothetical protein